MVISYTITTLFEAYHSLNIRQVDRRPEAGQGEGVHPGKQSDPGQA